MKVNDGGTNYVLEEQRKYYCLFLNLSESSFYFLIYLFKQYKKITFQASLVHTHTHTQTYIFLLQNWDRSQSVRSSLPVGVLESLMMAAEQQGTGRGYDFGSKWKIHKFLLPFPVQVECNSKLDPTKTTLLKVQGE